MKPANVEILLSTYNGGRYLREQLNSIFNQTYQNFKVTIRDDGSTDDTINIINEYQEKYNEKLFFLKDTKNRLGSTQSFSALIEASTEEYIMLCDQDDVWLENKIEITLSEMLKMEESSSDIPLMVFTDLKVVDDKLNTLSESFTDSQKLYPLICDTPLKLIALNVVAGCTLMMNKISKKFILPIPSSNIIHDQWIAANISHYGKIVYLPVATILYRQHNYNVVGSNNVGLRYFLNKIFMPAKQLKIYSDLIGNLKFKVNLWAFFYYKIYFTIKRL